VDDTVCTLEECMCIKDTGQWMAANRLKLNADKTGVLWTVNGLELKDQRPRLQGH